MTPYPVIDVLFSPEALSCSTSSKPAVACVEHPGSMVAGMDAFGVERALLAPCKRWQCERHWICGEVQVDEIARYIQAAPDRLAGLAGYNPYCIMESLRQIDSAIRLLDMRGVYVPTDGAALSLDDRRMYPLYARCTELGVPVVLQVSTGGEKGIAHPAQLADVAKDFPELDIVAACKGALDVRVAQEMMTRYPNVFFAFSGTGVDNDSMVALLDANFGARCMWGSNGESWEQLLTDIRSLSVPEDALRSFLHGTAARIFQLSRPALSPIPQEQTITIAD